jgi:hypothetical protein
MGEIMVLKLIKLYHESKIKFINKQLPPLLKKGLEKTNKHGESISINESSAPYITGPKNNENIISEYNIEFNEIKLKLTYIESVVSAEMTIIVGTKIIGSIKKMERISDEIIDALFNTIVEYIESVK